MTSAISIGKQDFASLRENHYFYIDKSELSSLGQWQLRLARNEIYARYGYSFEDEELRRYFLNKSWYEEDSSINKDTWSDDCLNEYEKANRNLIVSYEEEMGYR